MKCHGWILQAEGASAPSRLKFRVEPLQFDPRCVDGELPIDGSLFLGDAGGPRGNFGLQRLEPADASVFQALAGHATQLAFRHVEPASVLGGVVDALTGELRCSAEIASSYWGDEPGWGALADVLSSDGNTLNMRNLTFDKQLNRTKPGRVLRSTKGILEDAWFHRQDWASPIGGKGQLVVFNDELSISVVNPYTGLKQRRKGKYKEFNQVGHLHQKFARYEEEFFPIRTTVICRADSRKSSPLRSPRRKDTWSIDAPFQPRAMVLAGDKVFTAGWVDAVVVETRTGYAKDPENPDPRDAYLRIHSAADGEQLANIKLAAEPVFDGMAVAPGQLLISLKNGSLVCMEGKE